MHLSQLDLNLLVVFDVVYTERNLTRAAEVLHLTQPAVSNALARLRRTLKDPLFVRTPDGMMPTPFARSIADRVQQSVQLAESCLHEDTTFDAATSDKTMLCSFSDLAEALFLPKLLNRIAEVSPNMSVRSYYVPRPDMPTELAAGTLDIAMDVSYVDDSNLHHTPLLDEEYVCAVRKDHPIVKRRPTLKQYLALGHIHVSSRRKGMGTVDQSLRELGHRRNIVTRIRDYTAAPLVVAQTDLACALPRVLANQAGLSAYPLPFETPPVSMHLYWHKSADEDPFNAWLRALVMDVALNR